ncbi:E2/UBC family protein [Microcoleus sp. B7-D4]|uniref:E2/UBC family protein n=1 Tax=Microcoleus sp. B7-D4 TaxID=2818696 RepID=UPI0040407C4D
MVEIAARIEEELRLLRNRFSDAKYIEEGRWVHISDFELPEGWSMKHCDLVFQIRDGYPLTCPYGFYIPSGLTFNGVRPSGNAQDPAPQQPPHVGGTWAFFSGEPEQWSPGKDAATGTNLVTWVSTILRRLREGA